MTTPDTCNHPDCTEAVYDSDLCEWHCLLEIEVPAEMAAIDEHLAWLAEWEATHHV